MVASCHRLIQKINQGRHKCGFQSQKTRVQTLKTLLCKRTFQETVVLSTIFTNSLQQNTTALYPRWWFSKRVLVRFMISRRYSSRCSPTQHSTHCSCSQYSILCSHAKTCFMTNLFISMLFLPSIFAHLFNILIFTDLRHVVTNTKALQN